MVAASNKSGLIAVMPAYAASASALIVVRSAMATQTEVLARQVEQRFGQHPDAEIYLSQPGLGVILGARVLAEFGDDPDRYADAKSRKNYWGSWYGMARMR
jgi:transposase